MIPPLEAWAWTALTAVLVLLALAVHTRIVGWLPEDHPGPARKSHAVPMSMTGFLPALLTVLACALYERPWLALGIGLASLIGGVDDVRKRGDGLDWRLKAAGLCAAAAAVTWGLHTRAPELTPTALVIAGVLLFCLTNAFNFLDNTDGVCTALGITALALVHARADEPLAIALACLWLGFLPWNWPRARTYLGDAGAYAIGLAAAALALEAARRSASGELDALHALAPVVIPALDFTQVVLARLFLGLAPWIGDRRHLTHIATHAGLPRWMVAPLAVAITVAVGGLAAK